VLIVAQGQLKGIRVGKLGLATKTTKLTIEVIAHRLKYSGDDVRLQLCRVACWLGSARLLGASPFRLLRICCLLRV